MKFRHTLILIAVLAILGGYVYFFEVRKPEKPSPEEAAKVIWTLETDKIVEVTVRQAQEESAEKIARVKREAGQPWRVETPVQEPADDVKVTNIVARLAKLEATRLLEASPSDVAIYGLQKPQLEFTVKFQDGGEQALLVGDMNPTKTGYFVQRRGEPAIYLMPTSLIMDLKEWLTNPPLVPTPTATATETPVVPWTPTATETPMAAPEASATPTATPRS